MRAPCLAPGTAARLAKGLGRGLITACGRGRGHVSLFAVALAFAAALAVFSATRGDERAAAGPPPGGVVQLRPDTSTDAQVQRLQEEVRRGAAREADLAAAYLQKARESGDPSFYARADGVLRRALARGPEDAAELGEAAALAAGRHDFREAARLARRARALAPDSVGAYPILVDALVELGRYDDASRALQRLVDLRPGLAAYARVAYFRELHGDLRGAAEALALAVSAGGAARENVAYVQSLLGTLELSRGRLPAARRAFSAALGAVPGYAPAAAGRARLAARTGHLAAAIERWRRLVARLPLPEHAIALGEAELAAARRDAGGDRGARLRAAARRDLDLVRAQEMLLADAGVNADVELAIFEADHGDRRRGVALARAAWGQAPSVRSADALGWALTRAGRSQDGLRWARRALRLGSLDPTFRYHAGMAALAAGRRSEGRRHLRLAVSHGLAAYPVHLLRAKEALR
jgi:tetratricopeptide (TPR) repeat protein